jgi:hypothetical protein
MSTSVIIALIITAIIIFTAALTGPECLACVSSSVP